MEHELSLADCTSLGIPARRLLSLEEARKCERLGYDGGWTAMFAGHFYQTVYGLYESDARWLPTGTMNVMEGDGKMDNADRAKLDTHRDGLAERGVATRHDGDGRSVHAYSPKVIEGEVTDPPSWLVAAAAEYGWGLCRQVEGEEVSLACAPPDSPGWWVGTDEDDTEHPLFLVDAPHGLETCGSECLGEMLERGWSFQRLRFLPDSDFLDILRANMREPGKHERLNAGLAAAHHLFKAWFYGDETRKV